MLSRRENLDITQGVFLTLVFACLLHQVCPTSCPIDPDYEATAPGNSYECPDTLPDGSPNEYNHCCQADRPDENGDTHTCCQDPAAADAANMQEFINICIIIVCITACIMTAVFVHTYCKDDTFKCLKPLKRECRKHYNMVMDAFCFCSCCPKKLRRKSKKEQLEEKEEANSRVQYVDPSQQEVPSDDFWVSL